MRRQVLIFILISVSFLIFNYFSAAQEKTPLENEIEKPGPIFIQATFYPTASLSRYDYNNDLDLYEIRAYVVIRKESPAGEFVNGAKVIVNSTELEWNNNQYEKRIKVDSSALPDEIHLKVIIHGEIKFENKYPIPFWVILTRPRPLIIKLREDNSLTIAWMRKGSLVPVDVYAYNFKKGNRLLEARYCRENELPIETNSLPQEETILRIYVISSWIMKQYLWGENLVKGSEVNIIPWSQVFIRLQNLQK